MPQNKFLTSIKTAANKTKEITMAPVKAVQAIKLAKQQLKLLDESMSAVLDPDDLKELTEKILVLLVKFQDDANDKLPLAEELVDFTNEIYDISERIDNRKATESN